MLKKTRYQIKVCCITIILKSTPTAIRQQLAREKTAAVSICIF